MKVALIGIGRWGKVLHGELSRQAEVKYQCDSKTDLGPVLGDPEVEAVFIATPIPTHYQVASRALEAGKHVFLEKPGGTSSRDLEKLVHLAESKKLTLAIGYEFVHHPSIQKIKELITGKDVTFLRLEWQKWGPFNSGIEENLLCHDISILKFLGLETDSPVAHRIGFVTAADIIATRFGTQAMSIINRVNPIKSRTMLVKLEDASYLWHDNDGLYEIVQEELQKIDVPSTTPVAAEIADFFLSIQEGRKPLTDGHFGLEVYTVIEKIA